MATPSYYIFLKMSLLENDLDASLAGQRNRNDKRRENFETLKAQYISLHEVS